MRLPIITDAQGRTVVSATTGLPLSSTKAQYLEVIIQNIRHHGVPQFRFKQLSLDVLFDTKQGGKFYSRTRNITNFSGTSLFYRWPQGSV